MCAGVGCGGRGVKIQELTNREPSLILCVSLCVPVFTFVSESVHPVFVYLCISVSTRACVLNVPRSVDVCGGVWVCNCVCLPVPVCLCVCLCLCDYVCLFVSLSLCVSVCPCLSLCVYLFVSLCICLPVNVPVYLSSTHVTNVPLLCLPFVFISVRVICQCLYLCLCFCLCLCLYVCLCLCLSL